ncbi:MAG: hypothetical protein EA378_10125 [Phycisphaerales bacterium]|nr:MAG: hypothetical protein EA378_10125 [Phycisphaerales bacterium]
MIARFWLTAVGLTLIGVAVLRTRGAWRAAYWAWRWETAFGRGVPPRRELIPALLEFARWTASMRRLR